MSTLVTQPQELTQPRYDRLGNLALSINPTGDNVIRDELQDELQQALRLSGVLQTTLDVEKIIEIFAHEIGKMVDYRYLSYSNPEAKIDLKYGPSGPHSCTYRLVVSGESLGEIVFSRRKKFTEQETSLLETLLCGMVYPLRNALLYQKALEAAHRDPLTGVNNRCSMDSTIEREVQLALRHNTPVSLLAMDIDHFKQINDTYGHAIGDCVIKAVAEAATIAIRSSDMVFRYGGEEFLILLSNTNASGAALLAERLRKKIEDTCIICDAKQVSTTVSIGITCLDENDTRETLFSKADAALYQAKTAGRNCCKLYSPK